MSTKDINSLKYTSGFFPIDEKYWLNINGSLYNGGQCKDISSSPSFGGCESFFSSSFLGSSDIFMIFIYNKYIINEL
jgi:hypothetical protein